ncbi:AAA family ATPase [Actinoplanes sp. NPDC026670]|uniref:chloramphenicol phosphotransferase CPT family protein n=1 Tax=Actinoplanes sp. NPDC026670 TaxID=3154700 RepID=UPI0033DFBE7C
MLLLNGASSSGKSSVVRALLPLLADPWFVFAVDGLTAMRSAVHTRVLDDAEIDAMLTRMRRGYHRAVAGLVSAGNDVIMDYPLSEAWRLADLVEVLAGVDVTLVEVRCSPVELARREVARGDRPVGLAVSQTLVYGHGDRDIVVDTTDSSALECAREIVAAWGALTGPKAFERLRQRGERPRQSGSGFVGGEGGCVRGEGSTRGGG